MHSTHTSENETETNPAFVAGSLWLEFKAAQEVYLTAAITVQLDLPLTYGSTSETPMASVSNAIDTEPAAPWITVLDSFKG